MLNEKKTVFLGIVVMLFIFIFASGCKKTEVYDLDINSSKYELDNLFSEVNEEVLEDEIAEEPVQKIPQFSEKLELEVDDIIFEDLNWKKYTNIFLKYSVEYPSILSVVADDLDQHIEFIGPLIGGEYWPNISISHYNNNFYNLSEEVSVAEWVKPFPGYYLGDEINISGLDTLHYVQDKTSNEWAVDYFYFIKDRQLYNISITHTNDKQDWELYNKLLNSFVFDTTLIE